MYGFHKKYALFAKNTIAKKTFDELCTNVWFFCYIFLNLQIHLQHRKSYHICYALNVKVTYSYFLIFKLSWFLKIINIDNNNFFFYWTMKKRITHFCMKRIIWVYTDPPPPHTEIQVGKIIVYQISLLSN